MKPNVIIRKTTVTALMNAAITAATLYMVLITSDYICIVCDNIISRYHKQREHIIKKYI